MMILYNKNKRKNFLKILDTRQLDGHNSCYRIFALVVHSVTNFRNKFNFEISSKRLN